MRTTSSWTSSVCHYTVLGMNKEQEQKDQEEANAAPRKRKAATQAKIYTSKYTADEASEEEDDDFR